MIEQGKYSTRLSETSQYYTEKAGLPNSSFCVMPWTALTIDPDGRFRACCLFNGYCSKESGEELNIKNNSISEARTSHSLTEIKKSFLEGKQPSACASCWREEEQGKVSIRLHTINKFNDQIKNLKWNLEPNNLISLDLKIGNLCNLKCRICGSWSSSSWALEELQQLPKSEQKKSRHYLALELGKWPQDKSFWVELLTNYIKDIKYIDFTGGEPFMSIDHFDFLRDVVDLGIASGIEIIYSTNGTVMPTQHHLWKEFKKVELAFSIDDVGKRFEYERSGSNWGEVEKNITKFKSISEEYGNISLTVAPTVNIYNVYYLEELAHWLYKNKFDNWHWSICYYPSNLSIINLPPQAKKSISQNLLRADVSDSDKEEFKSILRVMNKSSQPESGIFGQMTDPDRLTQIKKLDQIRSESFEETFPELAKLIS